MAANGLGAIALGAGSRGPHLDWRERERMLGLVLLAPACVLIFGLILYPLIYDVAFAFSDASLTSPGQFVGLSNFGVLLGSGWFWDAARNSLIYTVLTSSVRLVLGVGIALALFQMRRGRILVFLALFIPWVFPAALTAVAFYWILTPPFHTFYTMDLLAVRWMKKRYLRYQVGEIKR